METQAYVFDYDDTLSRAGVPLSQELLGHLTWLLGTTGATVWIASAKSLHEQGNRQHMEEEERRSRALGRLAEADEMATFRQRPAGLMTIVSDQIVRHILDHVTGGDRERANRILRRFALRLDKGATHWCVQIEAGGQVTLTLARIQPFEDSDADAISTVIGDTTRGVFGEFLAGLPAHLCRKYQCRLVGPKRFSLCDTQGRTRIVKLYYRFEVDWRDRAGRRADEFPSDVANDYRARLVSRIRQALSQETLTAVVEQGGAVAIDVTPTGKEVVIHDLLEQPAVRTIIYVGDDPAGSDRGIFEFDLGKVSAAGKLLRVIDVGQNKAAGTSEFLRIERKRTGDIEPIQEATNHEDCADRRQ